MTSTNLANSATEVSEVRDLDLCFTFKTYGVTVRIESNDAELLATAAAIAKKSFLERLEFINVLDNTPDLILGIAVTDSGQFELWEDGKLHSETPSEAVLIKFFTSYLRVNVAEKARQWVFVHAGVVGRKGRAILIPGNSFSGKTTLVAELVKLGAEYFSDEYAVLDADGMVHPFPRDLHVRLNGDRESAVEIPAGELGAVATSQMAVGLVVFTEYSPEVSWRPRRLSLGNGIKEMIPHTIPIRSNTEFAINVLNASLTRAIMLAGSRPSAATVAPQILSLMDDESNWS